MFWPSSKRFTLPAAFPWASDRGCPSRLTGQGALAFGDFRAIIEHGLGQSELLKIERGPLCARHVGVRHVPFVARRSMTVFVSAVAARQVNAPVNRKRKKSNRQVFVSDSSSLLSKRRSLCVRLVDVVRARNVVAKSRTVFASAARNPLLNVPAPLRKRSNRPLPKAETLVFL